MSKQKQKHKNKNEDKELTRPAIVVILGHVDHGKSSIREAIKDLKITSRESGGITQHISAYEIEEQGKKITFIDTPGHEAFSAMRTRGAQVADIAVLVIAADEGVKPQTKEVIEVIKKANMPMVVAINKIDKPASDPERVKRELAKQEVLVESMGGNVPSINVSAKNGQGIPELLEMVFLIAEMESLKVETLCPSQGWVIESHLDPQRGATVMLILEKGILKKGQILATASATGRVKILEDFQKRPVERVLPSMPAIVIGFEKPPLSGQRIVSFKNMEEAQSYARGEKNQEPEQEPEQEPVSSEDINPSEKQKNKINFILKADVTGSLEVINSLLEGIVQTRLTDDEEDKERAGLKILKSEVGEVNESDVKMAMATGAKIVAFRVKVNPIAKNLSQRQGVTIMIFDVIYELTQAVKSLLEKKDIRKETRTDLGEAEVLAIFRTEKNRQIIGGKVIDGQVKQGALLDIYRQGELFGSGRIIEVQKNKKKVKEVLKGQEYGLLYQGDKKIEEGDIFKVYLK